MPAPAQAPARNIQRRRCACRRVGDREAPRIPSFFGAVTEKLLRAGTDAGIPHFVALSIVGAAAHPFGYYAGKALQEQLVEAGPLPWTVLRSTQVFEFAEQNSVSVGPFTVIVKMRSRPAQPELASRGSGE